MKWVCGLAYDGSFLLCFFSFLPSLSFSCVRGRLFVGFVYLRVMARGRMLVATVRRYVSKRVSAIYRQVYEFLKMFVTALSSMVASAWLSPMKSLMASMTLVTSQISQALNFKFMFQEARLCKIQGY